MSRINTVLDLLNALEGYPMDMPVRFKIPEGRYEEYVSISGISEDHLKNQETGGDPEEYWHDPKELEPEDQLKEGDTHFKYQGKLVLLS